MTVNINQVNAASRSGFVWHVEDFPLEFRGFGPKPSLCGIRLLKSPDEREIIVIASAIPGHVATSITNGIEVLQAEVDRMLRTWRWNTLKFAFTQLVKDLTPFVAVRDKSEFAAALLTFWIFHRDKVRERRSFLQLAFRPRPYITWLERWPVGTGVNNRQLRYVLVRPTPANYVGDSYQWGPECTLLEAAQNRSYSRRTTWMTKHVVLAALLNRHSKINRGEDTAIKTCLSLDIFVLINARYLAPP